MKYGPEDKPGLASLLLYGLQWWVVSLPSVVIMGVVVSRMHYTTLPEQIVYMQKLFGLMGIATVAQVLFGHRLPLVIGPASTLLVGIIAAQASSIAAIYTAIITGGALVWLTAACGLLHRLRFFFTPRIVAVILILIAFTLSPTILKLVAGTGDKAALHMLFAVIAVLVLVLCNKLLPGVWKSLTVLIGILGGTLAYYGIFGFPASAALPGESGPALSFFIPAIEFHVGTILAFLFCYLALVINELGSIESIGHMLQADKMDERIRRGVSLLGISNVAAGGLGIIGPVDYSMSAGIISATGCASRHTLVPAGLGLAACAFFPGLVQALTAIPGTVMGMLLLYLMASQLSSGLSMLTSEKGVSDFNSGMTVGLPLMVGLLISFAPQGAFASIPDMLLPIAGNGFVMGTLTVIFLEHIVFSSKHTDLPG